jgi:hypothetical protein
MPAGFYTPDNVRIGEAILHLQVYNPSVPAVYPVDTKIQAFDLTAYTAPWVSVGATNEGLSLLKDTNTTNVTIEEQQTPVATTVEDATLKVQAELAEDTLQTMIWAWGSGSIVTTAAASGIPGKSTLTLADELLTFVGVLETKNKFGFARRYKLGRMMSVGSTETAFRRAADKRMYSLEVSTIESLSAIQIVDITAAALP